MAKAADSTAGESGARTRVERQAEGAAKGLYYPVRSRATHQHLRAGASTKRSRQFGRRRNLGPGARTYPCFNAPRARL